MAERLKRTAALFELKAETDAAAIIVPGCRGELACAVGRVRDVGLAEEHAGDTGAALDGSDFISRLNGGFEGERFGNAAAIADSGEGVAVACIFKAEAAALGADRDRPIAQAWTQH